MGKGAEFQKSFFLKKILFYFILYAFVEILMLKLNLRVYCEVADMSLVKLAKAEVLHILYPSSNHSPHSF